MKRLKTISIFIFACAITIHAQTTPMRTLLPAKPRTLYERYIDSLQTMRQNLDNVQTSSIKADYAPLFLPTTFYKGVSHRIFSYAKTDSISLTSQLDEALLNIYLHRPDLVRTTESQLDNIGPALEVNNAIKPKNQELTERVAPKTAEPEYVDANIEIYKPNFWNYSGDYYLQFLQNYVSNNWYKGGESNYSMVGSVTLQANYNNKQKVKWDNKLEMKLGFQTSQSDQLHKLKTSEDLLRYTGKIGFQATKKWYYTAQLIAYTQFMKGYKNNDPFVYSDFINPLNVNLSVGMDYEVSWFNKRLTGNIHLAPAAYNFKYVSRLDLSKRYGLKEGNHTLHDIGSECTIDLLWKMSDMIKWRTRLYGYTTYRRGELDWENTFTFQFNRYISSNLFIFPRFDDGAERDGKYGYWQLKEYASLGFSYSF